jgi:hypothetical protein
MIFSILADIFGLLALVGFGEVEGEKAGWRKSHLGLVRLMQQVR